MEIMNSYAGTATAAASNSHSNNAFFEPKRYTTFIDLYSNYKFLGEVFRVDDLLDFTNEDIDGPITSLGTPPAIKLPKNGEDVEGSREGNSKDKEDQVQEHNSLDLIDIPCDDIAELEWLSNFVEDTSSIDGAAVAIDSFPFKSTVNHDHHQSPSSTTTTSSAQEEQWEGQDHLHFPDLSSVPGRARSKRARTNGSKVWSSDILTTPSSSITGSSPHHQSPSFPRYTSATTTTTTSASSLSPAPEESLTSQARTGSFGEMVVHAQRSSGSSKNKARKRTICVSGQVQQQLQVVIQKCLHCGSQKTPQWRTGPLGPKTLCNACGVRYKSGRLFPEYRPAASPSFVPQKHSNSHKKVLEMRRHIESPPQPPSSDVLTTSDADCDYEYDYE